MPNLVRTDYTGNDALRFEAMCWALVTNHWFYRYRLGEQVCLAGDPARHPASVVLTPDAQ